MLLFPSPICVLLTLIQLFFVIAASQLDASNNSLPFDLETSLVFPYTVIQDETSKLSFNFSFLHNRTSNKNEAASDSKIVSEFPQRDGYEWSIFAKLDGSQIAELKGKSEFFAHEPTGTINILIKGNLPGRATLYFCAATNGNNVSQSSIKSCDSRDLTYKLYVERKERPIDIAFNVVVILLVVMTNIGMGAKIDFDVVKAELKRPIAPAIGLCCQFLIMPMIAFGIASSIKLDPGIALGFFALGCAPGGSASNAYTHLLGGNVSLSVTMTLISTIAALGLLPMWLFTLGKVVYNQGNVQIPYENIFFSLLGIIVPVLIGLFLQRKFPKVAKMWLSAVKYIVFVFIVFVLTVGVYANVYIFSLLSGEVLLAAALLPYLGFLLGGIVACIFRQGNVNIITIAVETGIQNTGIPIVLLRLSLLGPDKDTSIVAPVASALFTPIPLVIGILYVQTRMFLEKRRKKLNQEGSLIHQNNDNLEILKASGDYQMVKTDTSEV
ncbi:unnamed protein product [Lymnaea stagnalis]|uniref:Ileal sodium/bile acid cotransporter n=1 Tax=Lymnaea stagnalis TaxID=6523 RepID=A0AAV2ID09_LYMST